MADPKPDPKDEPKGGGAGNKPSPKRPAGKPKWEGDKHPPKGRGRPPKDGKK